MKIAAFSETHDSSVCLIENGTVDFFCKEERLSGVKRDYNPRYALKLLSSLYDKIDLILYCTPEDIYSDNSVGDFPYKKELEIQFNAVVENHSKLHHHVSHASLAFYNSKFKECLVIVADHAGSIFDMNHQHVAREAESVYLCSDVHNIVPLYKNFWIFENYLKHKNFIRNAIQEVYKTADVRADSFLGIVKVYEAATTLIGQHVLENGKTMGLSSYGKNTPNKYFCDGIPVDGKFISMFSEKEDNDRIHFNDFIDYTTKNVDPDNYQFYADRALEVQTQSQEQVLALIKKYVDKTGIKNVCLVGGYGLNVVSNGYYVEQLPEVKFYFEPIADDTGAPMGACMLEYARQTNEKPKPIENPFFHYFNYDEPLQGGHECDIETIASLLQKGKSVAIFDGNPESGPRALGHRSILFDARIKEGKDIVNKIKKREWYRPFAGVILQENFKEYFYTMGIESSPHMTINFFAKEGVKDYVPAIIHVDNSCRIQTVSDGFLYELLRCFKEITNCPILLNTSFNLAGKPLVQTKADAIETLNDSSLDAVYFVQDKKIFTKNM